MGYTYGIIVGKTPGVCGDTRCLTDRKDPRVIGTTLHNRYRIDAELGQGGMGVVYRAHDTLLDRAVAVKVLSDSGLGTEGRARLLREAQAAAGGGPPAVMSNRGQASAPLQRLVPPVRAILT